MPPGGGCTGGTAAEPKADPGNLCMYAGTEIGSTGGKHTIDTLTGSQGASRSGSEVNFEGLTGLGFVAGSWAVTAP